MITVDDLLRQYYDAGKTRQQAMALCGITSNNKMSGLSHRLNLHWSWPLENRLSGQAPPDYTPPVGNINGTGRARARALPGERRSLGPPLSVPSRRKPLTDTELLMGGKRSPYPKPSKELPFETIAFLARELYEKPFADKVTTDA